MPSDSDDSDEPETPPGDLIATHHHQRTRRASDPSSNRPLISRRHSDNDFSPTSSDDEEAEVEYLPDRFDAQGRPIDRYGLGPPRVHSRRGEFAGKRGGWDVAGRWQVAGTDDVAVEKIVKKVTDVVEGRGSILGLLGGIISGSLLEGGESDREDRLEDGKGRRLD